jgi:hypothetical protein
MREQIRNVTELLLHYLKDFDGLYFHHRSHSRDTETKFREYAENAGADIARVAPSLIGFDPSDMFHAIVEKSRSLSEGLHTSIRALGQITTGNGAVSIWSFHPSNNIECYAGMVLMHAVKFLFQRYDIGYCTIEERHGTYYLQGPPNSYQITRQR